MPEDRKIEEATIAQKIEMEKCLLFEKLEASLAYCSVPYDDQLPHIQVFVGFTVCHFLCKNNIGNIGKGKQECFGTTKKDRTV